MTIPRDVLLAMEAVGVDGLQDAGAVAGAGGDLGRRGACVQPQRQGGVPQVVGAASQAGGSQGEAERGGPGGVPGAAVDRFAEDAAAGAAEQPLVRGGPLAAQVVAQQRRPRTARRDARARTGDGRDLR
jgi:hypothetical protein